MRSADRSARHATRLPWLAKALGTAALVTFAAVVASAQQPPAQPPNAPSSSAAQSSALSVKPLTRDEAVALALAQASTFQQARLAELIAAEDVKQAKAAFLPKASIPSSVIYNSPTINGPSARGDRFSFISTNAITEYQALAGVAGELDVAGGLRATLRRQMALLEAARAGTEVARRALVQAVDEAYYGLALAAAKRGSAELSVAAAEEFDRITALMLNAGEVAQVDLTRARLQSAARRDELEQARVAESVAGDSLKVLIGYDFAAPVAAVDLSMLSPDASELNSFTPDLILKRPEFAQFDALKRAAEQDAKAARAERLPQFSYSIYGGFDSDSLHARALHETTGVLATVSVTIPLFDWGASKSREQQARLRSQTAESQRILTQRGLAQQFNSSRTQALSAAARIGLLRASLAEAQRNVEASIARYRAGEASIIEVTDSQSTLAAARAALNQAVFDYQIARTRLAQATAQ
ncbi:MAG: TolC family protein [Acidobacteriota bacterium]